MFRMQDPLKRSEVEGATSDDLRTWLTLARAGDGQADHQLMCALIPVLITFYTRRLTIGRDDLENLVRETLARVRAEQGSCEERTVFGKWLFDIARRTMLEHLDRKARLAALDPEAQTIDTEYRVLPRRASGPRSPHPRFWE